MDLYDIAVARKLSSGGGGGGGSSDFSTAEVTVVNPNDTSVYIYAPCLYTGGEYELLDGRLEASGQNSTIANVLLYKGFVQIFIPTTVVSISGDFEDWEDGFYGITGDCTITLGQEQ